MTRDGGTGGLASYILAPRHTVWKIPSNLHLSTCANIGRNYFAAYHSLKTLSRVTEG
eukprot:CAMPEP_0172499390 /NCGR_PEP_ID=MMETSP1066-20121228/126579_1 /TAXON_ID=671091 /ORGANISM="Coscinodiscus wailesii, Strain CCMP2513" /LENGTH=56 /DNA_ID=CAMNT_0013273115 /DNA_START=8 /DNA_END=174 /DNA_ORIENTATION=+